VTIQAGQTLLHYRLIEKIGEGGMGVVWRAEDTKLRRHVALKVLPDAVAAKPERRARFEREARAVAALNHPNIVTIHSVEEDDGVHFLTMEAVEGKTLTELIPANGMALERFLEIALPLVEAVGAAHQQGVIHRDLKPSNLLMDSKGLVKIVDFGIASATSKSDATLTQVGSIIGTPAYLSPERARGLVADHRSDIYALGIIAYVMFCGKLPYVGEPMSLLFQHIEGKAKPAHEVRDTVNPRVSLLVQKLMAVDVDDRLQTMEEAAEAIRDVQMKLA